MVRTSEANEIDLDRLAPRFRRVSGYATAQAGYMMLVVLLSWAALAFALPAGLLVAAMGAAPGPAIGAAAVVMLCAFILGWLLYWTIAETLRLNRVMAFLLGVSGVSLVMVLVLLSVAGLGFMGMGVVNMFAPGRAEDGAALSVYLLTGGVVFLLGAAAAFVFVRMVWSYVAAAFARPEHRRMLKPISHTDAKLLGGQRVIFGGGVSIPTLKRGSMTVRSLNVARCIFAGLGPLIVLNGLLYLGNVMNLTPTDPQSGALRDGEAVFVLPFLAAGGIALIFAAAAVSAYLARACLQAARKRARFGLDAIRSEDARAPTLFLRPFHDDQVLLTRNHGRKMMFAVEPLNRELDHILVEEFSWSGPVVAIGRPGDEQAPFGAARTFVSNEEWRTAALALAAAAGEIVVVVDDTPGVQWEIDQVCALGLCGKTLFLMHPRLDDPAANLRAVESLCADLDRGPPGGAKPVLGLWLREDGSMRVLRASDFSVEAYTLALRDFFRSRAEAQENEDRLLRARSTRDATASLVAATSS